MMSKWTLLVFLGLGMTSVAWAATSKSHHLLSFQANAIAALQSGGDTESAQINWTPSFVLGSSFSLRGNFGVSLFKSGVGSKYLMGDYEALLGWNFLGPFVLEAGGGAQSWFNNGGTKLALSGNLAWDTQGPVLGLIHRFFVGYTRVSMTPVASEIRAGVGMEF